jgi:hypothetical protein
VVTGFPGTDIFLDNKYKPENAWKETGENLKKIIWAPHHTIDDDKSFLSFSAFLIYADYMLELAAKYKSAVQWAFKPHPILKPKLYEHPQWGKKRTDAYYNRWNEIANGQLEEGSYHDLFLTSDAMIHDSGSFLIEYLYLNKPVCRTDRDDSITDRLNKFGVMAYNMHYHARSEKEIEEFLVNVVIDGARSQEPGARSQEPGARSQEPGARSQEPGARDTLKGQRSEFLQKYLLPPNNR